MSFIPGVNYRSGGSIFHLQENNRDDHMLAPAHTLR